MADKFCGKDFLLGAELDPSGSPGVFTEVAAMRDTSTEKTGEEVDVTDKGTMPNKQLLACGVLSKSISAGGNFSSEAAIKLLEGAVNTIINLQVTFGNGDTDTGPYFIASFARTGPYNAAEDYTLSASAAALVTEVRA